MGGLVFTIFGAIYYWFPKATGRMLDETLGKWHFWLFVIGFHMTFDTMHLPGLLGMPRRIYTYEAGRGWDIWNLICTVGVAFQAAGLLVLVWNMIRSHPAWTRGRARSVGRVDARVDDDVAASCLQLRHDSDREEPAAAVGPQASRGSRLEVRVRDTR